MYKMAKGTKTARVITSWRILSCGRVSAVYPIRFAGTWRRYSKSAIDQLTKAAMYQARWLRFRRCAYHAKVMKTLDRTRSPTVFVTTDIRCSARVEREIHAVSRKRYWTRSGSEAGVGRVRSDGESHPSPVLRLEPPRGSAMEMKPSQATTRGQ